MGEISEEHFEKYFYRSISKCPAGFDNPTAKEISRVTDIIKTKGITLASKKVTAGFDGFVDTIVKIIKSKQAHTPPTLFNTTVEFGNYIVEKGGTSFGLEVEERNIKLGGNMPIMANTLGMLSVHVNCVGALGYPQTHRVFKNISSNCHLYSFADPGSSTAFEFNDGKIIFAQMGTLNSLGWDKIKEIIGIETLISLYRQSDLLCVVNWSEIDTSSDIWKGLLADVFPHYSVPNKKQITFFDLSDCSKRSKESITEALMLLKEFSRYTRVILSLNKNETRCIHEIFYQNAATDNLLEMGKHIFEKLDIETLLLHSPKQAMAINREETFSCDTFFVPHPKLSTGAGDHFNAGFTAGQLLNCGLQSSLILANAVSAFYVETGVSPEIKDVVNFLEEKIKILLVH